MKTESLALPIISLITIAGSAQAQIAGDHLTNNNHNLQPTSQSIVAEGDVSWEFIRPTNTGMLGDYCNSLFIDDDDTAWISAFTTFWEEGGMSHFDGTNWRALSNIECEQLLNVRFTEVVKADDGIMWIASENGLYRFDPTVEPWCVTRFGTNNTPIPGDFIRDICIAPDGSLWMTSKAGDGALVHYTPATDTWEVWDTSNGIPWDAVWNWVDYVAVQPNADEGYTVWFGNRPMGLASLNNGVWTWYGGSNPPPVTPLPVDVVGERSVDAEGNLLLITDQGYALRAPDGTYTLIPTPVGGGTVDVLDSGRVVAASGSTFSIWDGSWTELGPWGGSLSLSFGEESDGSIWVCGTGGAAKYADGFWQRYRVSNTGMLSFWVNEIAHAPNGDVAMTANAAPGVGGFDILHPDRTWTNANVLTYGIGLSWPWATDHTTSLAYRTTGNLVFAPTNFGVREYDGDGYRTLLDQWSIDHLAVDGNDRVWAATHTGNFFRENDDGLSMQRFSYSDGLPTGRIAGIEPDPNNPDFVWIGSQFGLAHTDGTTWELVPREALGLDLNTIGYHIEGFDVASDGTLWVASGIGLFHYDPATGLFDTYDLTNSPLPTDDIFEVEVAPDGSVWIGMFDFFFPHPGGIAQLKDGQWTVWQEGSSPLPHNQIYDIETRSIPDGGYEVWIACASEAIAVMTIEGPAACPADLNDDGELNFFDISAFLNTMPDFNNDGEFNFFDVSEFLSAFGAGCP